LLVLKCVADQETIERFLPTIETIKNMIASEFLDDRIGHHLRRGSIALGFFNSLPNRGNDRGGASSAS
jgi:hypothetical protein